MHISLRRQNRCRSSNYRGIAILSLPGTVIPNQGFYGGGSIMNSFLRFRRSSLVFFLALEQLAILEHSAVSLRILLRTSQCVLYGRGIWPCPSGIPMWMLLQEFKGYLTSWYSLFCPSAWSAMPSVVLKSDHPCLNWCTGYMPLNKQKKMDGCTDGWMDGWMD